ncbi:MAG: nuclear transport factor 2 family protein [Acidobacteriaceae bacterium]
MRMNPKRIVGSLLTAFVLVSAAVVSARAESCGTAADRAAVAQAVNTMFAAAAKDNMTLFHSVAAPNFYAFDNGRQFHGDELMAGIRQLHAEGHVFVWKVTEPEVHVGCHIAWITEINRGSVDGKSTSWLESGTLKKTGGKWRVEFFNSARAVEAPPSTTSGK